MNEDENFQQKSSEFCSRSDPIAVDFSRYLTDSYSVIMGDSESEEPDQIDALCSMIMRLESDLEAYKKSTDMAIHAKTVDKERNPLIAAVLTVEDPKEQARFVKRLLIEGADINAKDNVGRTALMYAASQGCKNSVQVFLAQTDRIDILSCDNAGNSALMLACASGHDYVSDLLLNFVKENRGYETLLDYIDAVNSDGETAITLALKQGNVDCANVLSEHLKYCLDMQERDNKIGAIFGKTVKSIINIKKKPSKKQQCEGANELIFPTKKFGPLAAKRLTENEKSLPSPVHLSPSADFYLNAPAKMPRLSAAKSSSCHNLVQESISGTANISINVGIGMELALPVCPYAVAPVVDPERESRSLRRRVSFRRESSTSVQQRSTKEKRRWSNEDRTPQTSTKYLGSKQRTLLQLAAADEGNCDDDVVWAYSPDKNKSAKVVSNKIRRLFDRRSSQYTPRPSYVCLDDNDDDGDSESSIEELDLSDLIDGGRTNATEAAWSTQPPQIHQYLPADEHQKHLRKDKHKKIKLPPLSGNYK